MVNSTLPFSSISTPSPYPESSKRYLQGTNPDLRIRVIEASESRRENVRA